MEVKQEAGRDFTILEAFAGLVGVALLAFAVRAIGFEWVCLDHGETALELGDALYHARLTLWSWANFPHVLRWDAYLNAPDGAAVPWPPLFDWVLAGAAHLIGGGRLTVDRTLAWSGPVFGALTAAGVFAAARQLGSRALALGCAAILGLLPISVSQGAVGNSDHHAAVACVGACLLASCMALLDPMRPPRKLWLIGGALTLARTAMILLWPGSLLYVVLVETTVLLRYVATGQRTLLHIEITSVLATAALVAPIAWTGPIPVGGPFSAVALSRLHVLVLVCVGVTAALADVFARIRPHPTVWSRTAHLLLAGGLVAAMPLLFSGPREGIGVALRFLTLRDEFGGLTAEQRPLFPLFGRRPLAPPQTYFGWFAYLLPLAPIAALDAARERARRPQALALAGWTSVLGLLCLSQIRYGYEFGPGGSVGFGLVAARVGSFVACRGLRRPRLSAACAAVIATALLSPAIASFYLPGGWQTLRNLRGPGGVDRALATPQGTLLRFFESVRDLTPPTSGYLDPDGGRPEYSILAGGNIGHAARYVAERPTMLDGFWGYVGRRNFELGVAFYAAKSEREGLSIAARLRSPYVVTSAGPEIDPETLLGRLQLHDGAQTGAMPRLEHFRLMTEGPANGHTVTEALGIPTPRGVVPYKLFEIVRGAILEIRASPSTPVVAAVAVRTPLQRIFRYEARTVAGADGIARLEVPYATQAKLPVRTAGDWIVRAGEDTYQVAVAEEAVVSGLVVQVPSR